MSKSCDGCGEDYEYHYLFEGLNNKYYCINCLGIDNPDTVSELSIEQVEKLLEASLFGRVFE